MSFPPFDPGENEIVLEAIEFTKDKTHLYHYQWKEDVPEAMQYTIDTIRRKVQDPLDNAIECLRYYDKANKLSLSEINDVNDILCSSLYIYMRALEKVIDPELPESKLKYIKVKQIINSGRFANSQDKLFLKVYEGYKSVIKKDENVINKDEKLIFFSYSSNDKKFVGELSKILEEEHGLNIFRAHDTIDVNDIWREEIRIHLDQCQGGLAYISDDFLKSDWAQQECGYLMGQHKPIFTLFKVNIPGLLEERQGMRIRANYDIRNIANEIARFFK